jgi:prenyltransferase beta subunit
MHGYALNLWCTVLLCTVAAWPGTAAGDDLLPRHVTAKSQLAVVKGLDYLARTQGADGSWRGARDGASYPVSMTALAGMAFLANGNTTSRGPYADNVRKAVRYLIRQQTSSGLIAGAGNENGRPMYGHGFSLLFLSTAYGMETDAAVRAQMHDVVKAATKLTAVSQSAMGGWTYVPGMGDEGSVTITQMQALRAAHNAGFTVPKATIEKAIRYLENCRTPEGGIRYSFNSGNQTRLPISAAAICSLYSAGEYDSPLAESCLELVFRYFRNDKDNWNRYGHSYYANFYAAQAFYQAGDEYWDAFFPVTRDQLLSQQQPDGSWNGDGIGPTYGTSLALVILQLPYKFLPVYQR